MRRGNSHGAASFGDETPGKSKDFRYIINLHSRLVKNVVERNAWVSKPYVYVDLTAGPGHFPMADGSLIEGSPVIVSQELMRAEMDWRAWLFEEDEETADLLALQLGLMGESVTQRARLFRMDHAAGIDMVIGQISRLGGVPYGLIYADPNGTWLPYAAIRRLTNDRCLARVDVLCYVAAANYKRFRKAFPGKDKPFLRDHLMSMGKQKIYLREPRGPQQWSFAFLTNWTKYPSMHRCGFYDIEQPKGAAILDLLDRTQEERGGQAELGFAW